MPGHGRRPPAAAGNARFYFADVRDQFAGHELCDSAGWLNSVNIFDVHTSYDPTATGQADGLPPGVQRRRRGRSASKRMVR